MLFASIRPCIIAADCLRLQTFLLFTGSQNYRVRESMKKEKKSIFLYLYIDIQKTIIDRSKAVPLEATYC